MRESQPSLRSSVVKEMGLWRMAVFNSWSRRRLKKVLTGRESMKSKLGIFVLALSMVLVLGGCATKSVPTFTAKYYPDCYDPIDKLCKDQSNQSEVKGAVAGGLLGALGGAIVGGLTTGKVEGALVGAGVGAAAGAATGFFAARLNKIQDQNQRLEEYQNILGERSKGWDLERASVEKAYKCYGDQIDVLHKAMREKKISREEFKARMQEIKDGIAHINTYWADAQHRMDESLADGDKWLIQEDAAAAKEAKAKQAAQRVAQQKKRTAQLKQTTTAQNDKVNELKSNVESKLAALDRYATEDEKYAANEMLLAMI